MLQLNRQVFLIHIYILYIYMHRFHIIQEQRPSSDNNGWITLSTAAHVPVRHAHRTLTHDHHGAELHRF